MKDQYQWIGGRSDNPLFAQAEGPGGKERQPRLRVYLTILAAVEATREFDLTGLLGHAPVHQ